MQHLSKYLSGKRVVQPLLSRSGFKVLGLHHRVDRVLKFTAAYSDLSKGLGKLKDPYHIELEQGVTPFALPAPRCVILPLRY